MKKFKVMMIILQVKKRKLEEKEEEEEGVQKVQVEVGEEAEDGVEAGLNSEIWMAQKKKVQNKAFSRNFHHLESRNLSYKVVRVQPTSALFLRCFSFVGSQ